MLGPLILHHSDFCYTRMKAVTWSKSGPSFPTIIEAGAGNALASYFIDDKNIKPLVINCIGINGIENYGLEDLRAVLEGRNFELVFLNASQIEPQISKGISGPKASFTLYDGQQIIVYRRGGETINEAYARDVLIKAEDLERQHVRNLIKASFVPFSTDFKAKQRLASTPILANGVFDAGYLISKPERFIWISLKLSDELEKLKEEEKEDRKIKGLPCGPLRLLAVSLRGSPLAASVGLIGKTPLDIEIIDHMGPKHQILEEYDFQSAQGNISYIFIGDFIIGGTELKIAQHYARQKRGELGHALVLGTLLDPKYYHEDIKLRSLVNLKDLGTKAEYGLWE